MASNIGVTLAAARSFNEVERERFVEIGDKPIKTTVVRNGKAVVAPLVDHLKVDALVDRLVPVRPALSPRVVSQSVPPGTRVQKGTAIDLVLVAPLDIDIGVIANAHEDLVLRPIADVAIALEDPKLIAILGKYDDPEKVTEADKAVINQAADKMQIQLDPDPQSKKSLGSFLNALEGAHAFL